MASKLASSTMSEEKRMGKRRIAINFFVEQYNSEKARADETLRSAQAAYRQ